LSDSDYTPPLAKTCRVCGEEKGLEAFTRNARRPDGRDYRCRECLNAWRRYLYQADDEIRLRESLRKKAYLFRYPPRATLTAEARVRLLARETAKKARKRGALQAPPACEDCGGTGVTLTMHHEDYSKAYAVDWLCRPCHLMRHGKRPIPTRGADD
jgi:hypothetical protein